MPELPEIETVKRGIIHLTKQVINDITIRNPKLRYPISDNLKTNLINREVVDIYRRAKYLIFQLDAGYIIIHLGMSGKITLLNSKNPLKIEKHDHIDITFKNDIILRYNDPRRFGCLVYYAKNDIDNHPLLKKLGPEPLDNNEFNATYLLGKLKNRSSTIKQLIMDNHIVVGVGNIYASEALFLARISPLRPGNSITNKEATLLVSQIKLVLQKAIELGGSTLRDYKRADGSLGYFQNTHNVYGKAGENCKACDSQIVEKRLGQRNSFYCPSCQK